MGNKAPCMKIKRREKTFSDMDFSTSEIKGFRSSMEDETLCVKLSLPGHYLFAVFDGHGGQYVSKQLYNNFISFLELDENWLKYKEDLNAFTLALALETIFQVVDQLFDSRLLDHVGSTANVCIITPCEIVCANSGDSRSILVSNSEVKDLSVDHKPTNKSEKERIEKAHGFVSNSRLGGDLALSRAFGDFHYKNGGLDHKTHKLTSHPDVTITLRTGSEKYLVLACDGIWDVFDSDVLANEIKEFEKEFLSGSCSRIVFTEPTEKNMLFSFEEVKLTVSSKSDFLDLMTERFVYRAVQIGSYDNCSLIIVKLD